LYHAGVRIAVRTVLGVSERLHQQHPLAVPDVALGLAAAGDGEAVGMHLPILPPEMWIVFLGFFLRRIEPEGIVLMGFFLRSNWAVV
jgi:hypothetical protein